MKNSTTGIIDEGVSRRHLLVGATACALSLVLHILGVFCVSRMELDLMSEAGREIPDRQEKLSRVFEMRSEFPERALRPDAFDIGTYLKELDSVQVTDELEAAADEGAWEPPSVAEDRMTGEAGNLAQPTPLPERETWQPRQEILAIEREVAADEVRDLERRRIPDIERVPDAPDIVVAVDRERISQMGRMTGKPPAPTAIERPVRGHAPDVPASPDVDMPGIEEGSDPFEESAADITSATPIDNMLKARLDVYSSTRDLRYGYFRISVERIGAAVLPVIPKDIVFLQDSSASITEQRLHFCRDALVRCLSVVGPEDRFNIMSFRDAPRRCFPDWAARTDANIKRAEAFVSQLTSEGNTDIFASTRALLDLPATPGRPVIAFLITDGAANTGLTRSSNIIGEFSKLNDRQISVFTMGTAQTANAYLLDLLSYCNGGESFIVSKGRWDIPDSAHRIAGEMSRPVLSGIHFNFADVDHCEVYPTDTGNLYLDRPMVLYGRYKRGLKRVVFQSVGEAGESKYDMIFDLPLAGATRSGDKEIRVTWARQKLYHLIGSYTREPDPQLLAEIEKTAKRYRLKIPYRGKF